MIKMNTTHVYSAKHISGMTTEGTGQGQVVDLVRLVQGQVDCFATVYRPVQIVLR